MDGQWCFTSELRRFVPVFCLFMCKCPLSHHWIIIQSLHLSHISILHTLDSKTFILIFIMFVICGPLSHQKIFSFYFRYNNIIIMHISYIARPSIAQQSNGHIHQPLTQIGVFSRQQYMQSAWRILFNACALCMQNLMKGNVDGCNRFTTQTGAPFKAVQTHSFRFC